MPDDSHVCVPQACRPGRKSGAQPYKCASASIAREWRVGVFHSQYEQGQIPAGPSASPDEGSNGTVKFAGRASGGPRACQRRRFDPPRIFHFASRKFPRPQTTVCTFAKVCAGSTCPSENWSKRSLCYLIGPVSTASAQIWRQFSLRTGRYLPKGPDGRYFCASAALTSACASGLAQSAGPSRRPSSRPWRSIRIVAGRPADCSSLTIFVVGST
jgi:hypothetical protein